MRIITGKYKGQRLWALAGLKIRPTSDRLKESLFNLISSYISESRVLDLFAGTGNLGLEALSRGAKAAVFVDKSPQAIQAITKNIKALNIQNAPVYRQDILKGLHFLKGPFDIIFMDPPYNKGLIEKTLNILQNSPWLLFPNTIIVIESSPKETFNAKGLITQRKYDQSLISILKLE